MCASTRKLLHLDNAELVFTDAALHAIAKKTVERKSGARGLRSVVEDLLIPIMYDIPSDATITKVTIDADTVRRGRARMSSTALCARATKVWRPSNNLQTTCTGAGTRRCVFAHKNFI